VHIEEVRVVGEEGGRGEEGKEEREKGKRRERKNCGGERKVEQ
jgi:hypothetical protein